MEERWEWLDFNDLSFIGHLLRSELSQLRVEKYEYFQQLPQEVYEKMRKSNMRPIDYFKLIADILARWIHGDAEGGMKCLVDGLGNDLNRAKLEARCWKDGPCCCQDRRVLQDELRLYFRTGGRPEWCTPVPSRLSPNPKPLR